MPARRAALAIGSNSVRMLCVNQDAQLSQPLRGRAETALFLSLSAEGAFSLEAMAALVDAVGRLREQALQSGASEIALLATSAVRDAVNGDALGELLLRSFPDMPMHVLSGAEEARLAFVGAGLPEPQGLRGVIDIGGGSTELAWGDEVGQLRKSLSLQLGASRLLRQQRIDSSADITPARALAERVILDGLPRPLPPCGCYTLIGGTGTAAMHIVLTLPMAEHLPDDAILTRRDAEGWLSRLAAMSADQRAALPGMPPTRLHILPTGLAILCALMRLLDIDQVQVSERNNLDGYLYERWLETQDA